MLKHTQKPHKTLPTLPTMNRRSTSRPEADCRAFAPRAMSRPLRHKSSPAGMKPGFAYVIAGALALALAPAAPAQSDKN
jgi:hypothetical protein